ncbi:MAG: hypothetical protein AAGK00_15180 [Pseudomonadota bacterium]
MTDQKQAKEFKRVARELECDEDEARFNATLKQVAKDGTKKPEKPED